MADNGTAGKRDKFVTIEQLTESLGDSRRPIETWTPLTQAWMERIDATGTERFASEQLSSRYDTRWVMAYQADMDPETLNVPKVRRLNYGRIYDIVTAKPIGRHDRIELSTIAKG